MAVAIPICQLEHFGTAKKYPSHSAAGNSIFKSIRKELKSRPDLEHLGPKNPSYICQIHFWGLPNHPRMICMNLYMFFFKYVFYMVCSFHVLPWFARPCWMLPAYLHLWRWKSNVRPGLEAHHLRSICSFDQFCPGVIIRNCRLGWREKNMVWKPVEPLFWC